MAIDTTVETPLSFCQAAKLPDLPIRRGGKRPCAATLWRWALRGVRGIKLESIVCGGARCTSAEALRRFFARLTEAADKAAPAPQAMPRRRDPRRSAKILDEAGIR